MTIISLCESNQLPYNELMEAVEEFVDTLVQDATPELYEATAKRLLGETLSHDEIMMGVPYCSKNDLIVLERAPNMDQIKGVKFNVSTLTQVRQIMTKLRLGRKGVLGLYKIYQKMLEREPEKTDSYLMSKAAGIAGIPAKEGQIILTKFMQGGGHLKEFYLNMADEVLTEETPTNTSGSAMADHEPSDGDRRMRDKKLARRKKKLKAE